MPPSLVPDTRPALVSCPHGNFYSGRVFGFSHPQCPNSIEMAA